MKKYEVVYIDQHDQAATEVVQGANAILSPSGVIIVDSASKTLAIFTEVVKVVAKV